ncbi:sensor histidine kinase [Kordia jejudonensis]|uniref:sensor histidine kinase n=1 Tax=Kordia jejudonensis TaxID=1348245 RepID=UPI000629152A|nr:sensor histidine kinase [Kordia jejudonensis]
MVNQAQEGTSLILYGGMLGMFFLAIAIVGFVLIYKKRLLQQKITHQQQLLDSAIEIQDEERKRFAADLHDEIGGGISTILLSVSKLKKEAAPDEILVEQSDMVRVQLDDLLKKVREISYNIMPPTLEDFGLNEALSDVCYTLNETGVLNVDYEWNGSEKRLKFSTELAIYRIIKELITNVVKHAAANTIAIQITNNDAHFKLIIKDDGKGFDPETVKKGAGLRNIYDRALILGANLAISSKKQQGTITTLQLKKNI